MLVRNKDKDKQKRNVKILKKNRAELLWKTTAGFFLGDSKTKKE
jgi:hypothetical protein